MPFIKIAQVSAKGKIFHAQAPRDPVWESKEGLVAPFFCATRRGDVPTKGYRGMANCCALMPVSGKARKGFHCRLL